MVERIYLDNHIRKLHIRYMLCVRIYVTAGQYLMETISELIYTPKTERDYGTLACWGKNSIGKQSDPCLFQVVPAGKYAQTHIRINMRNLYICSTENNAVPITGYSVGSKYIRKNMFFIGFCLYTF